MKQKSRFLIPILALLLCATSALAFLFYFGRNMATDELAATKQELTDLNESWNEATDHILYFDDGLWKNANIYMENLVITEHSISFTITNNTHYAIYFPKENIIIQRYENGQWVKADEIGVGYTEEFTVPQAYTPTYMRYSCSIRTDELNRFGEPIYDRKLPIPDGYYRIILPMDSYNVVGYLNFP